MRVLIHALSIMWSFAVVLSAQAPAGAKPPEGGAAHRRGGARISRRSQPGAAAARHRVEPRGLDSVHLHHARHGGHGRGGRRGGHRRSRGTRRRPAFDRRGAAATRPPPAGCPEKHADGSPPPDRKEAEELARLGAAMAGVYGRAKVRGARGGLPRHREDHRDHGREPRSESACARSGRAGTPRPADAQGLRAVRRAVEQGRAELGFADTGAMWRAKYDMPPTRSPRKSTACGSRCGRSTCRCTPTCGASWRRSTERQCRRMDRFRRICSATSGQQEWSNIYDAGRARRTTAGFSLTDDPEGAQDRRDRDGADRRAVLHLARVRAAAGDVLGAIAVRQAARPRGRLPRRAPGTSTTSTICASRCASTSNDEDFTTIHHELGHNFYQRAYNKLPVILRDSANDGFHEAIGDTIALSVTPEYLVKIGLLDKAPDASADTGAAAARRARQDRVPAVRDADRPMALAGVLGRDHAGRLQPGVVGAAKLKYQGVAPPVAARRGVLRSGREVPRAGERAVRALLPGRNPPVPVPPRAVQGGRLHRRRSTAARSTAARKRATKLKRDAGDGRVASRGRTRSKR